MEISSIHEKVAVVAQPVQASVRENEDRRVLIQAVHSVNEARLLGEESEPSFIIDRLTQRSVVRIVDRKTREVIQQFPSEQVLRIAEELQQRA